MKLRAPMPLLDGANWLNNKVMTKEMLAGRPTLFHFWSVSCNLCKNGLDTVNLLVDKYAADLNVIAVHMPRTKEDMIQHNVKAVADYYKMGHPLIIDTDFLITDRFNNRYVPAYYIFDGKGELRHYQAGGAALRILEKRIQRLIVENKG
ncbi:MAG: TlpA family protein disulfide reductase [Lysinibacillus sp.]